MEKKESTEETLCSKQKMENLIKGKTQWQVKLEETDHKNEEERKQTDEAKWRRNKGNEEERNQKGTKKKMGNATTHDTCKQFKKK